jgi:hypothetical protein
MVSRKYAPVDPVATLPIRDNEFKITDFLVENIPTSRLAAARLRKRIKDVAVAGSGFPSTHYAISHADACGTAVVRRIVRR